jgi:Tfp pilus assembly protein PilF
MRRAMRINPVFCKNDCVISYNAGMIFSKCGETEEAIKYVKHSLSLNPDFDSAKTLMNSLMKHAPHANA